VSPERALKRRNLVLRLMRTQGKIDEASYRTAAAKPVADAAHATSAARAGATVPSTGKYFEEELRRQLVAQFGNERVLRGGLRVYSTYDPELQKAAEDAVTTRIAQIAKVSRRARALQGSLVSIDATTGDVRALVGGRDFLASSFNRATQARRQAGSAFKPIVYAAALERGYGPATRLTELDVPIEAGPDLWLPGGEHEEEEYTLRRALKLSSNRAAAQLFQQIGASTAVYYAQRLGISSPLPVVPSLALGTGEVTLLELTTAYTAFANRGITSVPRLFTRVDDSQGTVIAHQPERHVRAVSESTAYMMSSMLADVVSSGTATRVRGGGFRLPAAGKTGTSDDYADAWFIGYTPHLVTGVWFGLDIPAPIMSRGFANTVAVPAWTMFMKAATRGDKPEWFQMPSDVEKIAMCRISGARATPSCRHYSVPTPVSATHTMELGYPALVAELPPEPAVFEELYKVGSVSSELCPVHGHASTSHGTPLVDAVLRRSAPVVPRRVVGADGVVRLVKGGQ
jgi:penicillin-binding protein 1A